MLKRSATSNKYLDIHKEKNTFVATITLGNNAKKSIRFTEMQELNILGTDVLKYFRMELNSLMKEENRIELTAEGLSLLQEEDEDTDDDDIKNNDDE